MMLDRYAFKIVLGDALVKIFLCTLLTLVRLLSLTERPHEVSMPRIAVVQIGTIIVVATIVVTVSYLPARLR